MGGAVPPLPHYAFMEWCSVRGSTGTTLHFTFIIVVVNSTVDTTLTIITNFIIYQGEAKKRAIKTIKTLYLRNYKKYRVRRRNWRLTTVINSNTVIL
jgi:hypothetical protein